MANRVDREFQIVGALESLDVAFGLERLLDRGNKRRERLKGIHEIASVAQPALQQLREFGRVSVMAVLKRERNSFPNLTAEKLNELMNP